MDIEVGVLISKVRLNPPVWDTRLKEHSNRNIVNACWRKISGEMQMDGAALRKKWKYLRDQFCVEYTKIKYSRSGHYAETGTAEPKWLHFKRMLFLKDIVTPRAPSSNLKPKASSVTDDDEPVYVCETQESDNSDLNAAEGETSNDNVTETPASQSRKRRRVMATNTLYGEKISQPEQQNINTIQSAFQREPDDDDLLFFKSLLPFVSQIPTEHKLQFRSRIHRVVEQFAFAEYISVFPSEPLPPPTPSRSSSDSSR